MKTPIHSFLQNYTKNNTIRCHMPGGKGKNNPFDITEIEGADNLYEASGIILESEEIAASLFGAGSTLYSCGGSTLAIQGMLSVIRQTCTKNTIIAGRYSHKSLINTAIMLDFDIKWAYPKEYLGADISPDEIERLIDEKTAAVFINSIDYYGGKADISAICEVCKKHSVPLLVDNAHGAYLVFTDNHPIKLGADMTADSAHKTLPSLTGGAYLHLRDKNLRNAAENAMAMFGSSSPSYVIMDSLDTCNRFISEQKNEALRLIHDISVFKLWLSDIGYTLKESDAVRVTIDTAKYGYTGCEFAGLLRSKGAECEMCDDRYVVLLFSVTQNKTDFMRLYSIMRNIPKKEPVSVQPHIILHPKRMRAPRKAYFSPFETIRTEDSLSRICRGVHTSCPPCVPIVMPGEKIDKGCIAELLRYGIKEIEVIVK